MKALNPLLWQSGARTRAVGGLLTIMLCLSATQTHAQIAIQEWVQRYDGGFGDDKAAAIATDIKSNVYVTGCSQAANAYSDWATIKYSSAGLPLWTNRYNGPANYEDCATDIAVDRSGDAIVTGNSRDASYAWDWVTIRYSNAGVPVWTNRYNGPANHDDWATAIAVDAKGGVVVSGYSVDSNYSWDWVTIHYSGMGVPLWTNRYSGPANGTDAANAIAVDAKGKVYVTGYSWTGVTYDYLTIKYSIPHLIPLAIRLVENQLVLSWTNAAFRLQCAPSFTGPFTDVPGATSPYTNSQTGSKQFFRLVY